MKTNRDRRENRRLVREERRRRGSGSRRDRDRRRRYFDWLIENRTIRELMQLAYKGLGVEP